MSTDLKKILSVFRSREGIIVEGRNELGEKSKSVFDTESALLNHLDTYKNAGNLEEYELNVSNEFWAAVINHLSS